MVLGRTQKTELVTMLMVLFLALPTALFATNEILTYSEESDPPSFDEVESSGIDDYSPCAAGYCQCVDYIKNRYGLKCSANAKSMGSCLTSSGFKKLSTPVAGAVIIFQPNYGGGINTTYGHIGVVTKVVYDSKAKSYTLTVRGANQGGSTWTEYNCSNVSELKTTYTVGSARNKALSFYAK